VGNSLTELALPFTSKERELLEEIWLSRGIIGIAKIAQPNSG
jgi:hypothetical protein